MCDNRSVFLKHNLYLKMIRPSAKDLLITLLHKENEERSSEKDSHGDDVDIDDPFKEPSMWNRPALLSISNEIGLKVSTRGVVLCKTSLMRNLKRVMNDSIQMSDFVPTPFGYNYIAYWLPIVGNISYVVLVTSMSICVIHLSYVAAESFHNQYECSAWLKMYSLQCYVLKKVRHYLEDMNYNIVYSTICALSVALTSLFVRLRRYNEALVNAG